MAISQFKNFSFAFFWLNIWLLCSSFEGIIYKHIQTKVPQSIHILIVDPTQFKIVAARALDMGIGRESVASLAKRHGAVAAVNGGFFAIGGTYDGIPRGILKIGSNWYGLPYKTRGALGWNKEGTAVHFDRLGIEAFVKLGDQNFLLNGLNQPRAEHDTTLFSSDFGLTTLTNPESLEILIEEDQVQNVLFHGSSRLPPQGWILSLPEESFLPSKGERAEVCIQPLPSFQPDINWNELDYIVGGCPLLIRNGERLLCHDPEKTTHSFLHLPHARTAVGILPDQRWVFVVVDGKQPDLSIGMPINELSQFMQTLGCIAALNLDGGGSSTMIYDSKIVNHPAGDEDENAGANYVRRVSDAILILKKD